MVINKRRKHGRLEIILFFAASFIAIVPGFYFREHYFIMLLPSVSILVVEDYSILKINQIKELFG